MLRDGYCKSLPTCFISPCKLLASAASFSEELHSVTPSENTRAHHGTVVMLCVCSSAAFFIGPALSLSLKNKVSKQKWKFNESYLWREACIHYSFLVYHEATLSSLINALILHTQLPPHFLPKYIASASASFQEAFCKIVFWGNALYLIRFFSLFKTVCFQ